MNQSLNIKSSITLNNNQSMPLLGIGVALIEPGKPTEDVVHWALSAGYRHIDTAKLYKNEESVGQAIRNSGVNREEIWVTNKLWPTDFVHPKKTLEESLQRLGLDYIDLYLVHWPTPIAIPGVDKRLWRSMERLIDEGLCKSIGVSNYLAPRLEKTLAIANIPPAVNQVKCSPFYYPTQLHLFCKKNNVALEAYGPLTQGRELNNTLLKGLAKKYQKSTAQILLRWALQKNIIVIPKSQNQHRIQENANLYDFNLTSEDILRLDALSRAKGRK